MKRATTLLITVLTGGLLASACLMPAHAAPTEGSNDVATSFVAFKYWNGAFRGKLSSERALCFVGQDVTIYKKRDRGAAKAIGTAPLRLGNRVNGPARFRFRTDSHKGSYFARFRRVTIAEYAQTWICHGSRSETIEP